MKCLLVDDEALARERLRRLLERVRPDAECIEADTGSAALALARSERPDLLLLDIRMPGMDGIEVAKALVRDPEPPAIIFCTAFDRYALDALQQSAVAYLLKPVREADLARALDSATRVNRLQLAALNPEAPDRGRREITSSGHQGLERLPVDEIRCFIAEQKYVEAYAPEGTLLLSEPLKSLEQEFGDRFVRVHRNALVALAHIRRLKRSGGTWHVELNGVELQPAISRRHLSAVKQRLSAAGGSAAPR